MRYLRVMVHFSLLLTLPSAFYSQSCFATEVQESTWKPPLSYDGILNFFEELESGELEKKCNLSDLEKINYFLASLAKAGVLPNEPEEQLSIENDIEELLYNEQDSDDYIFSLGEEEEPLIISAVFHGTRQTLLCKTWVHKKWDQTKKFTKNHKKALIIGTVLVVVAVVTVGVATTFAAGGAAAAGAAASEPDHDKSRPGRASAPHSAASSATPILDSIMKEQISSFKERLTNEEFLPTSSNQAGLSLQESARVVGSLFAQDAFKTIENRLSSQPDFFKEMHTIKTSFPRTNTDDTLNVARAEIDKQFSTNYAPLCTQETNFTTLSYHALGEQALANGYLPQAVHDFGGAIEMDPTQPLPYLQRGIAHFGLGQYDRSLEDYREFVAQTQKTQPVSPTEFSLGFAKGLPQGIYDSAEDLFLFLTDLILHPITTAGQACDSFSMLSQLAYTQQWEALSEALVPEARQLVEDWDHLSPEKQGEQAGYLFGKYGSNLVIPGAATKVIASGVKGARELSLIQKSLQTTQQTLLLESVASIDAGANIADVIQASRSPLVLAEDLGFSTQEMAQLKQAGNLQSALAEAVETISHDSNLLEFTQQFKYAKEFLKPYQGKYISELEAKSLLSEAGLPTFPKPEGIPENYRVKLSDKGGGLKYVDPKNEETNVRVMPGKPHGSFPCQQKPYIIQMKNGKTLDKNGNIVPSEAPEAHIPLEEFVYRDEGCYVNR